MQKVIFVKGYEEDNEDLDLLNEMLEDGWYVESVTGAPAGEGRYPVFAFVLESDD